MPSIYDVAKLAKVAPSTVSYALNGTRPVSEKTVKRIEEAMRELGYRPNALARGLASRRTRNLGLIFPTLERGLGITEMEFVTSAAETASENGYHLVLWSTQVEDVDTLTRLTQQGLVDGVIVMEVRLSDARVELLRAADIPFCMIGRTAEPIADSYVDIDFEQTTRDAVRHLVELGHTTIAFINHSRTSYETGYGPSVRAARSFASAAEEAGITYLTRFCEDSPTSGSQVMHELVAQAPELTGLIVMNERASAGVLAAVTARGWRVPDDFSVVSVASSTRVADMTFPPLTTFSPPSVELGRLGVLVLIDRLAGRPGQLVQELLPCTPTVRGSTGPRRSIRQLP